MTDQILTIEIGGKTRELLLPAERILDAALSPDGFDLAVLTDEGVFVLDALDGDPPNILASPLSFDMAMPGFGHVTEFFYDGDGVLYLVNDGRERREAALHTAMLWRMEEEIFGDPVDQALLERFGYEAGTPLPNLCIPSNLVWEGNRPGYGIDENTWDEFAATLAELGEPAAYDFLRKTGKDREFSRRLIKRVEADIAYALPLCKVGFTVDRDRPYTWPLDGSGKPIPDYKSHSFCDADGKRHAFRIAQESSQQAKAMPVAPAVWVTFRDHGRAHSFWVVPHLEDGLADMRTLFRKKKPDWDDGREVYIHWDEYDFSQPDITGFPDSCFRDAYCNKPIIYHTWTLRIADTGSFCYELDTEEPSNDTYDKMCAAYDLTEYGDFRLAVLRGLAGAE